MKKIYPLLLMVAAAFAASAQTNIFPPAGSAGIGTTTPNASSLLEVTSTNKGVLVSRMTKNQRDAIATPATGLLIYQTNNTPGFYYYDGSAWTAVTPKAGANKTLNNLTAPTAVNVALLPAANNTIDAGSATFSWKDIYLDGSLYLDDIRFISNSGYHSVFAGAQAGNSNSGSDNSALGYQALYANTDGISNTANGSFSLKSNTTGNLNTANGAYALRFNSTGYENSANGSYALYSNTDGYSNTSNGYSSLFYNTSGHGNTANGAAALKNNTEGFSNTANGFSALFTNLTGANNTANGSNALYFNTTGYLNSANGSFALYSNSTGASNTANGAYALYSNTTGSSNSANGAFALYSNLTGSNNTAAGTNALFTNSTGDNNTAIGSAALSANSTGLNNTATGADALSDNLTGDNNTATGTGALSTNSTGDRNTASGSNALYSNSTGRDNTANGAYALYTNTSGNDNTAYGSSALYANQTGYSNVANGSYALGENSSGSDNTANGSFALASNVSGYDNVATGRIALWNNVTGYRNTVDGSSASSITNAAYECTYIGYDADQTSITSDFSNVTALGNISRITASNQVRIGNSAVSSIGGYEPWSDISDGRFKKQIQENVPGLEFINKLKPVTYHLDIAGLRSLIGEDMSDDNKEHRLMKVAPDEQTLKSIQQKEKVTYTGFIAQEVEAAAQEIGYDFSGVDKPQNENTPYGLRYSQFVVPLVKAVQELDERNKKLTTENEDLKLRVEKLEQLYQSPTNSGTLKIAAGATSTSLLGQNIPNPFDKSTLIPFRVPKDCLDASIMITSISSGKVISVMPVSCNEDHLAIDGGMLASGTYAYSLYVNGQIIDTKSMVIAK